MTSLLDKTLNVAQVFLPGFLTRNQLPPSPTATVDENGIHRRTPSTKSLDFPMPKNTFGVLQGGQELSGNGPCMGTRASKTAKYEWLSYQEFTDRAVNFGAGLVALGCRTDCEYLIGMMVKTSLEWKIVEFGCYAYGMVTAPLHDSLGPDACQESVNLYDIEVMVCGTGKHIETLLSGGNYPTKLRTLITVSQLTPERTAELENLGVKVVTFEQVEKMGKDNPLPLRLAAEDSLASLIFTSGTTGVPKAAMLTHGNFMRMLEIFVKSSYPITMSSEDTCLGVFPLSHIFERACEMLTHLYGGKVGFLSGDIMGMLDDAKELKPTFFFFVPRIMNRFYDQINAAFQRTFLGRIMAPFALAAKYRDMKNGVFSRDTIWDTLLFGKVQAMLGGRVRLGFAGSAATAGTVLNFARAVFGCYIFEFYGQTESGGPITCTTYGDLTTDHVGIAFHDVEVKLVDVPEMNYFAAKQSGEICCRSKCQTRGYYHMPDKTAETIDEDGWLHTGDIGTWTPEGNLKIVDRKKHIFKLSQGEYLAPERIESFLSRSSLITNVFVDGDSRYPYCVALIYPNYTALGITPDQITQNGKKSSHEVYLREKVLEDLQRLGKESGLKSYEVPKKFAILPEPFSLENGCLTTSQKTKREAVRTIHRERIQKIYEADSE